MHLDAVAAAVEAGMVLEGGEIEIGAELAIDAGEQIEIEFSGHPFGVVIGRRQDRYIFDQIDADHQNGPLAQRSASMMQEFHRLVMLEITDGRSRKKADPRQIRN